MDICNYNYACGHIVFKYLCKHMNKILFNSDFSLCRSSFQSVKKQLKTTNVLAKMPSRENIPSHNNFRKLSEILRHVLRGSILREHFWGHSRANDLIVEMRHRVIILEGHN